MTPHEKALEAVEKVLLPGSILEVTSKPDWGFSELDRHAVTVDQFLEAEGGHVDNIILHILAGEGVQIEKVCQAVEKACKCATRVIILEHDPASGQWKGNENVTISRLTDIYRTTFLCGYWGEFSRYDGRNLLYWLTTLPGIDESFHQITKDKLKDALAWQYRDGLPEKDRNIFCLSSECQEDGRMLDPADATAINSIDKVKTFFGVVGGLMFLEFIAEIDERDMVLFDLSLSQILYAMMVVEIIKGEPTLNDFDGVLKGGEEPKADLRKLSAYINIDTFLEWFRTAQVAVDRPDKDMTWRNLTRLGLWRNQYQKVRDRLIAKPLGWHWGPLDTVSTLEKGSIVYVSTVDRKYWDKFNKDHYVIEAVAWRDVPVLRGDKCV